MLSSHSLLSASSVLFYILILEVSGCHGSDQVLNSTEVVKMTFLKSGGRELSAEGSNLGVKCSITVPSKLAPDP